VTRTQRSTLIQWCLFLGGLVVVVAVLAVTVRWGDLAQRFFNWDDFSAQFPEIIFEAARNTLIYTAIGFTGGLFLGLIAALMRQSTVAPARIIATVYIEVFRALPALLTILIVGFGIPIAFGAENLPSFFKTLYGSGGTALALVAGASGPASRPSPAARSRRPARWA
jgi:polar amino acid transport system permease protein